MILDNQNGFLKICRAPHMRSSCFIIITVSYHLLFYRIKNAIIIMADIATKKFLDEVGLKTLWGLNKDYITGYYNKRIYVGTEEGYYAISDSLETGALIVITDIDGDLAAGGATSAVLGTGVLGKMILGQS